MCMLDKKLKAPVTLSNQMIKNIIVAILRIRLILPSIGIYVLTKYKTTPVIIRTKNIVNNDIVFVLVGKGGFETPSSGALHTLKCSQPPTPYIRLLPHLLLGVDSFTLCSS